MCPFYILGCLETIKKVMPSGKPWRGLQRGGRLQLRESDACAVLALGSGISISPFSYPPSSFLEAWGPLIDLVTELNEPDSMLAELDRER